MNVRSIGLRMMKTSLLIFGLLYDENIITSFRLIIYCFIFEQMSLYDDV